MSLYYKNEFYNAIKKMTSINNSKCALRLLNLAKNKIANDVFMYIISNDIGPYTPCSLRVIVKYNECVCHVISELNTLLETDRYFKDFVEKSVIAPYVMDDSSTRDLEFQLGWIGNPLLKK